MLDVLVSWWVWRGYPHRRMGWGSTLCETHDFLKDITAWTWEHFIKPLLGNKVCLQMIAFCELFTQQHNSIGIGILLLLFEVTYKVIIWSTKHMHFLTHNTMEGPGLYASNWSHMVCFVGDRRYMHVLLYEHFTTSLPPHFYLKNNTCKVMVYQTGRFWKKKKKTR